MSNYNLALIFEEVLDKPYNPKDKYDRNAMQTIVYLLVKMGINLDNYAWNWNVHGPYSIGVDCDSLYTKNQRLSSVFNDFEIKCINSLKEIINIKNNYTINQWLECLASIHYLKYIYKVADENIHNKLKERIKYLDNKKSNELALNIIKKYF